MGEPSPCRNNHGSRSSKSQDSTPFKSKQVIYRWFYSKNKSGFNPASFSDEELDYINKWAIWKNFNKLPWEWDGDDYPLVQDQNALQQMASWENDRERMTHEMEQQKASAKGAGKDGYSSNIRGPRIHID